MKHLHTVRSLAILVIVAAVIAACMPVQPVAPAAPVDEQAAGNVIEATFVCPDGTELPTVFDNDAQTVTVGLPDGEVTLPRVESGSGAKYSDGTTTFWNQGDEAMVQVDDETIYENCVQQDDTAESDASASSNVIEATFVCPDGTELPTVFDNDAQTVTVGLPDGEVTLPQTVSGSGARYANEDESIVFWNKGDEAMVEVNGETVYQGCVAQ